MFWESRARARPSACGRLRAYVPGLPCQRPARWLVEYINLRLLPFSSPILSSINIAMISVLTQSSSTPTPFPQSTSSNVTTFSELAGIQDAIEPFASLYRRSGQSVRLNCIVPTCYPRDTYYDLHDVHDIQSRSLVYLHSLVEALRAAGVPTSYKLSPSVTPLSMCLVFAIPAGSDPLKTKMTVCDAVRSADTFPGEKVLMASLENGPALVIT